WSWLRQLAVPDLDLRAAYRSLCVLIAAISVLTMRKAVTLITLQTNDNHTPSRRINKNPIFKGCIIPSRLPERLTKLHTILSIFYVFMHSVRNAVLCLRFANSLKS